MTEHTTEPRWWYHRTLPPRLVENGQPPSDEWAETPAAFQEAHDERAALAILDGSVDDALPQLETLTSAQLDAMLAAEAEGKNRKTMIEALESELATRTDPE